MGINWINCPSEPGIQGASNHAMPPFFHLGGSPDDGDRSGFEDGVEKIHLIHETPF
jgi:hypothetical protein